MYYTYAYYPTYTHIYVYIMYIRMIHHTFTYLHALQMYALRTYVTYILFIIK